MHQPIVDFILENAIGAAGSPRDLTGESANLRNTGDQRRPGQTVCGENDELLRSQKYSRHAIDQFCAVGINGNDADRIDIEYRDSKTIANRGRGRQIQCDIADGVDCNQITAITFGN